MSMSYDEWVDQVIRELGVAQDDGFDREAYRPYFDRGLSSAEACMRERIDAGASLPEEA